MHRKKFITGILGTSLFIAMDGFSSVINAISVSENSNHTDSNAELFITFGTVHLNNTSLNKSVDFWTKIAGMKLRHITDEFAEFGTESKTLVVVHQAAKTPYKEGYSGLYHFAIHATDKHEFAKMLYRIMKNNYPCSPTDHTMSKSIYLNDPDGITIEFALETPERFKRVISEGGLKMEGSDGILRSASARLNVNEVLNDLKDMNMTNTISDGCKIGHIHLYANNVEHSNAFYKQIGFLQFNHLPQYLYADVSAGGPYKHRVAMNAWHGQNKPIAPADSAGLRHYQIVYQSKDKLSEALQHLQNVEQNNNGYWVHDPTGNKLLLTHV